MRRPWIGLIVFVIVIAAAIGASWYWGGGDWGPRHSAEVIRVANADGTAIGPGNTIVIQSHRGGPFFPFFFLFPLFIFGFFFLMRRAFWGPRRSPWGDRDRGPNGTPPAWFDEWHRQAHDGDRDLPRDHRSTSGETARGSDPKAPDAPETPESR